MRVEKRSPYPTRPFSCSARVVHTGRHKDGQRAAPGLHDRVRYC